ncbi:MAG: prephenate dehydratase [Thermoleophilaceae bacterium]|nr:prephenate dehydratase [Thermoleophilaceae bacterium]
MSKPLRIAYLGPAGTFSEEALLGAVGAVSLDGVELIPCATNRDVTLATETGVADAAFVPIENSVEGSVTETLDALVHEAKSTRIVGELVWPVHHCLIASGPAQLAEIQSVTSHPQALAQCAGYLQSALPQGPTLVNATSTSEAVRDAVSRGLPAAAIGSSVAASEYGGTVLAEAIEDVSGNATRFVWLAQEMLSEGWLGTAAAGEWKTSVVFAGFNDTSPGGLVSILQEFASRSVNLTKIESRPERTTLGHYLFFADIAGQETDAAVADALSSVRAKVRTLRVLGSFPVATATDR